MVIRVSKPFSSEGKMWLLKHCLIPLLLVFAVQTMATDYVGKYCELDGVETESGEEVSGECFMYSDQYGEIEGAETESGESVSGECFRYSEQYAELEGAETESGEEVSGECYFYGL